MKKRILFFICLIAITVALALSISAEEMVDEIDISYSSRELVLARVYLDDFGDMSLVISGTGKMAQNVNTKLSAYKGSIVSVTIEEGVLNIPTSAFSAFSRLRTVSLGESIYEIGANAFRNCYELESINIPDKVVKIENDTFNGCKKLMEVNIPRGVNYIGSYAFAYCQSLGSIYIPDSVEMIRNGAFVGCNSLSISTQFFAVPETWEANWNPQKRPVYFGVEETGHTHNYEKTVIVEPTHYDYGEYLYICSECDNTYVEIVKPIEHSYSLVEEREATHTSYGAKTYLCSCGDNYVETIAMIPHSYVSKVTREPGHGVVGIITYTCSCGDYFLDTIPATMHSYYNQIIKEATHLEEGEMLCVCSCGDSYTEAIPRTTSHTYELTTEKEATHEDFGLLRYSCECGYSYTTATEKIPHTYVDGVCECGATWTGALVEMWNISRRASDDVGAFLYEDEENPGGLRMVISGYGEIWWHGIPWSNYRDMITSIEIDVVYDRSYVIPSGIFANFTALKSVKISEGITTIASNAFRRCPSLEYVELPSSILSIEPFAFTDCTALKAVYGLKKVQKIADRAFSNCVLLETIDGLEEVYYYGTGVFANCQSLKSIVLGYEIHELRPNVFENCRALETVVILGDVRQIPDRMFMRCTNLQTVIVNNQYSMEYIGISAFEGCSKLMFVSFAGGVEYIRANAFRQCVNLMGIDLGSNLREIEQYAFADCRSLSEIKLPSTVYKMGNGVFQGCRNLKVYLEPGFDTGILSVAGISGIFEYCVHTHFDHESYYSCGHSHIENYWGSFYITEASHYTLGIAVEICGCGASRGVITDKLTEHDTSCSTVSGTLHRVICPCGYDMTEAHSFQGGECTECGYIRNVLSREEIDPLGVSVREDGYVDYDKLEGVDYEKLYNGVIDSQDFTDVNCASTTSIMNGFFVPSSEIKRIALYTRAKIYGEISYEYSVVSLGVDEYGNPIEELCIRIKIEYIDIDSYYYDNPEPIYFDMDSECSFVEFCFVNSTGEECNDRALEISEIQFICNEKYVDISKNEEKNEIIFKPVNNSSEKENYVEMIIGSEALDGLSEADKVRIETIFGSIALDEMARNKIISEDGIKVSVEKTGVDKSGKVTYSISICDKNGNPLMPSTTVDENGEFIVQLQFKKGKNKDDIKIRYKGTDGKGMVVYEYMDILDYDPVTGIVTFKTKHFSDYEIYDVNEDMSLIVADLIEFKGYSMSETTSAICVGYGINLEIVKTYEELTGEKLDYGVLFASETLLDGKLPLDKNGNAVILEVGKVIKASLSKQSYNDYEFILNDITEDLYDYSFVIAAYAVTNGGAVYYQENGISKDVTGITYNEAISGGIEE